MPRFYNNLEVEKWLASIYPKYKSQSWHNNAVFHPIHVKHFPFFKLREMVTEKISPRKICGLKYESGYHWPGYKSSDYGMDWMGLFYSLKRLDWVIDNHKTKEDVVDHIHKDSDRKVVFQFGDHYFIQNGRHRLCLAKFLDVEFVEVLVHRYTFDKELFAREMNVARYLPRLKEYKLVPQDFSVDLNNDYLALNASGGIVFLKKEFVGYLVKRFETLNRYPYKGYINLFKARLSNRAVSSISKGEELYQLDLIIKELSLNTAVF